MYYADTMLAAVEPLPPWVTFLIMAGSLTLGALAVMVWFLMFRKKRHRKRRRHHQHEDRQLNPTLAQVGGLPPVREEDRPPGQTSSTAPP
jgi:hypothetical protein